MWLWFGDYSINEKRKSLNHMYGAGPYFSVLSLYRWYICTKSIKKIFLEGSRFIL